MSQIEKAAAVNVKSKHNMDGEKSEREKKTHYIEMKQNEKRGIMIITHRSGKDNEKQWKNLKKKLCNSRAIVKMENSMHSEYQNFNCRANAYEMKAPLASTAQFLWSIDNIECAKNESLDV